MPSYSIEALLVRMRLDRPPASKTAANFSWFIDLEEPIGEDSRAEAAAPFHGGLRAFAKGLIHPGTGRRFLRSFKEHSLNLELFTNPEV